MRYTDLQNNEVIIDVRTEKEFAEWHIPKAVNLNLDFIRGIDSITKNKQQNITLYCENGKRSATAMRLLKQMGYMRVTNGGDILDYAAKLNIKVPRGLGYRRFRYSR